LTGDTLFVGNSAAANGIMIFKRTAGVWANTQNILAGIIIGSVVLPLGNNPIAVNPTTAVFGEILGNGGIGQVRVWNLVAGVWTATQILTPSDGIVSDRFGRSVALSGNTIVVGAIQHPFPAGGGTVYLFNLVADV